MALTPRRLIQATLTNATANYYAAGTGIKTRIDAFTIDNFSAAPTTFSLWLVPVGGAADNSNILIKDRSIAVGSTARVLEAIGHWIEAGGTIQMVASANASLTVAASGIEQSGG